MSAAIGTEVPDGSHFRRGPCTGCATPCGIREILESVHCSKALEESTGAQIFARGLRSGYRLRRPDTGCKPNPLCRVARLRLAVAAADKFRHTAIGCDCGKRGVNRERHGRRPSFSRVNFALRKRSQGSPDRVACDPSRPIVRRHVGDKRRRVAPAIDPTRRDRQTSRHWATHRAGGR